MRFGTYNPSITAALSLPFHLATKNAANQHCAERSLVASRQYGTATGLCVDVHIALEFRA